MSTTPSTPSPAVVSLPEQGQAALLFLLFHGEAGDAAQMAPLARALREQYPQAAIVSLNAADRQWFAAEGLDETNHAARIAAALPDFVARIRSWAAHFELEWPLVALAGFGQGAQMALEALQAESQLAGRVIAVGGSYVAQPAHAPENVCVHLLHGMADEVLPYRPVVHAARTLVALGADVTADIVPDIGHELHPALVDKAMHQLRTFVPARLWKEAMQAAQEQGLAPEQ